MLVVDVSKRIGFDELFRNEWIAPNSVDDITEELVREKKEREGLEGEVKSLKGELRNKEEEIGKINERLESMEKMCREERGKREGAERKVENVEREKVAQREEANDKMLSLRREVKEEQEQRTKVKKGIGK